MGEIVRFGPHWIFWYGKRLYKSWRLMTLLKRKPLMLKIETTNICNAACHFCANGRMLRKRSVMSMDMFSKAVGDYDHAGGGPLSLTPVIGEVLLDPDLVERFRVIRNHPGITDVSFTTNLINHERHSDEDWKYVLSQMRFLQVSLGGLDAVSYREMYGVDAFDRVHNGILRLGKMKKEGRLATRLALAFRTTDVSMLNRQNPLLASLLELGWECNSIIDTFGNWAGRITAADMPANAQMLPTSAINGCCLMPAIGIAVLSDGFITGCSCMDYDGQMLLGDARHMTIKEAWLGKRRKQICESFERNKLEPLCCNCTAYQSAGVLGQREYFFDCTSHNVTEDFYSFFSA